MPAGNCITQILDYGGKFLVCSKISSLEVIGYGESPFRHESIFLRIESSYVQEFEAAQE
jgi:hypothetical protein